MNTLWNACLIGVVATCTGCGPPLTVSEVSSGQNQKVAEMTPISNYEDDEEEEEEEEEDEEDSLEREFFAALTGGDFRLQKSLFEKHPEMLSWSNINGNWVCMAIGLMKPELAKWLLDQGVDINWSPKDEQTALVTAIRACDDDANMIELVEYLLSRGANPNLGRPLIAAINRKNKALNLPLLKLLVKHGADVNRVHTVYGDSKNLISALDFASGECEVYLRSVGAKSAVELAGKSAPANSGTAISPADEVVNFFAQDVGPVDAKSLTEIVPDGTPINIHVIPASKERQFVTLFTTGLSAKPMQVPEDIDGLQDFEFAELFIQLPATWKYDRLDDPQWGWPIHQLRWLGKYPHLNDTWLGAPMTVVSRDPVEPLAPGLKFDGLLLMPDKKFVNQAGRTVQLYRLIPLYPEERELEANEGIAALMRTLDRISTPFIVDMKRKNAVK